MMQPIHYSMILNVLAMVLAGLLSWQTSQPLWLIVVIMLQAHVFERYPPAGTPEVDEEDEEDEQPMGFTAKIK